MTSIDLILHRLLARYETRAPLDDGDRAALLGLPHRIVTYEPGKYLVREGSMSIHCSLILSGMAFRHKLTPEGARQIMSFQIAGDFVDLESTLLRVADHNIQTLTPCETAMIPSVAITALIDRRPRIGRAMWIDTLIDASISRECIVNVGRRDARARLAHIFCEFARRLEAAGLAQPGGYEFPMSQEQLADASGLTPVHVNRTLRAMEIEGLLRRTKRFVEIPDWERLRHVAGFSELYLHRDLGLDEHAAMPVGTLSAIALPSSQAG